MGKPVVATRVGVVPEVLEDGRTALLVPAEEPAPLADGDRAPARRCAASARRLGAEASALGRERAARAPRWRARSPRCTRGSRRRAGARCGEDLGALLRPGRQCRRARLSPRAAARAARRRGDRRAVSRRRHLAADRGRGRALPRGAGRRSSPASPRRSRRSRGRPTATCSTPSSRASAVRASAFSRAPAARRPLLLDVDDWEVGFFLRGGLWGTVGRSLNLANPTGLPWTWLMERLCGRRRRDHGGLALPSSALRRRADPACPRHRRLEARRGRPVGGAAAARRRRASAS